MDSIGRYSLLRLPGGFVITDLDWAGIKSAWVVMAIWALLGWLAVRRLEAVPGRWQFLMEKFVGGFDALCHASLGDRGRRFTAVIGSTFMFILLGNWIGVLPGFHEPTKSINTCFGLGIAGYGIVVWEACRTKGGFGGYFKELFEPFAVLFPMNVIGEIAKTVSVSCRLFGNIMGGAIIITVVSHLTAHFLTPVGLLGYFGLFGGMVQAFVFTMLTLTYIAVGT